ncbi:UNVERIFIED_CONTAM: hypothetical protein FKN15_048391 [Acipenser sinensis]
MGRKSCRKQRKEQLVPQAAVATPLPPLPPGSPPSREIWDWLVHPEGNFAFDLPWVINTLCLRDGERWADWEKQHNPASVRDLTMVVLGYLAADMGGIPSSEQEGEEQSLPSPVPKQEEQGTPQSPPPAGGGSTVAGAPQRGATGYEERGRGPETCSHCSSFAAGDRGGGPETCSHCSSFAAGDRGAASASATARSRGAGAASASRTSTTGSTVAGAPEKGAAGHEEGGGGLETTNPSSSFAAGVTVAGAPQRGAASYEEGGGRGTTCPRSFFAAGRDQQAVSRATTGRGADSMASHGPTEASLPSPRLCPGLLGF